MKRILTICMACVIGILAVFCQNSTIAFVSAAEPKLVREEGYRYKDIAI